MDDSTDDQVRFNRIKGIPCRIYRDHLILYITFDPHPCTVVPSPLAHAAHASPTGAQRSVHAGAPRGAGRARLAHQSRDA